MSTSLKSNWPWRLLGVAAVLVCVMLYEPERGGLLQRVVLPLIMGVSAIFIVQNLLSVALAGTLLAGIHGTWGNLSTSLGAAPNSAAWIEGVAYPALSLVCLTVTGVILWQRFRAQMQATHEARWQARRRPDDRQEP